MKVKGSFLFMGVETTQSKDGKVTYNKIGLMQGLDSKKFNVPEVVFKKYENISIGTPVAADLDIGDFDGKTFYKLVDLQVVTLTSVNNKAI